MTLHQYMKYLGWSTTDLSRNADINDRTARRALTGLPVRPWVAQRIAKALSEALDVKVMPGDLEGLKIEGM